MVLTSCVMLVNTHKMQIVGFWLSSFDVGEGGPATGISSIENDKEALMSTGICCFNAIRRCFVMQGSRFWCP